VEFLRSPVQTFRYSVFQFFWHPDDTFHAAFRFHEFLGTDEMLAVSHEARRLYAAACHGRHLREGHSKRRHTRILTVGDAYSVGERLDSADTLETSAGSHGILHDGIQSYMLQGALREFLYRLVHIFVGTEFFIDGTFLGDHLAGSRRIQLVGRLGVKP